VVRKILCQVQNPKSIIFDFRVLFTPWALTEIGLIGRVEVKCWRVLKARGRDVRSSLDVRFVMGDDGFDVEGGLPSSHVKS